MNREERVQTTNRKGYQKPTVVRVKLVAQEAVLQACKTATGGVLGMLGTIPCVVGGFSCLGVGS